MENKIKIVHIHTDPKFIFNGTESFYSKDIENRIIFIRSDVSDNIGKELVVDIYDNNRYDFNKIINICNDSDVVVVFGLNHIKCKIVNAISKNVKIVWRLFGSELYGKKKNDYLSTMTSQFFKNRFKDKEVLKSKIYDICGIVKRRYSKYYHYKKAVRKIDLLIGLFGEEYEELVVQFGKLPAFLKSPILQLKEMSNNGMIFQKKKLIIVGNNRNSYNNHLDLIKIISSADNKAEYKFKFLLSYGQNDNYSRTITDLINKTDCMFPIGNYLNYNDFNDLYNDASAFVMNGYRQMAMFNIFTAIMNGVKVYLNKRNSTYKWMKNQGFILSEVSKLKMDIESDNLQLTEKEAQLNRSNYFRILSSYTYNDFQIKLLNKLNIVK